MSFGLIRGGHLDLTVLGGLQVDATGRLANWMIPGKMVPGWAARWTWSRGPSASSSPCSTPPRASPRSSRECTLPLTSIRPVDLVVTDLAVIAFPGGRATLLETAPGVTVEEVLAATEAELAVCRARFDDGAVAVRYGATALEDAPMSVVVVLLALVLLMFVAYRGFSVILFAPICALLAVLLTDPALVAPVFSGVFMDKVLAGFIRSYFPVFLLGAVFGKVIELSGFARSIVTAVIGLVGRARSILSIVLVCGVLTYGGVSLFVVVFAVYPLAAGLFRRAGIPKRLLPADDRPSARSRSPWTRRRAPRRSRTSSRPRSSAPSAYAAPWLGSWSARRSPWRGCSTSDWRRRRVAGRGRGKGADPHQRAGAVRPRARCPTLRWPSWPLVGRSAWSNPRLHRRPSRGGTARPSDPHPGGRRCAVVRGRDEGSPPSGPWKERCWPASWCVLALRWRPVARRLAEGGTVGRGRGVLVRVRTRLPSTGSGRWWPRCRGSG